MKPLESTSIHLVQSAAIRLVRLFPDAGLDQATIDEFNRQTDFEWERVRDFIILHYWANERGGEFWEYCRNMELPATRVVSLLHVGPYQTLGVAYERIKEYIVEQRLTRSGAPRETYLSPPDTPADKVQTIIEFPID